VGVRRAASVDPVVATRELVDALPTLLEIQRALMKSGELGPESNRLPRKRRISPCHNERKKTTGGKPNAVDTGKPGED
jgi:hypothetical protein